MRLNQEYRNHMERVFRDILSGGHPGQYDEQALPSYAHKNRLMAWLFWKRLDVALRFCSALEGKRVLDFGCGGGVTFKYLVERGCDVVGCDENLEVARQVTHALGVSVDLQDNLPAPSGRRFDYILALDVLEHIIDSDAIMTRFKELLAQEGRVVVSGPTENLLYRIGRRFAGFSGHYHVKNIYDIEEEFIRHGFRREALNTLVFPAPLFRISVWCLAAVPGSRDKSANGIRIEDG